MIRTLHVKQPMGLRDDEEPVGAGWYKAIYYDVIFRIQALTGLRWAFQSMRPHSRPDKRFIRWVHWDQPMEVRKGHVNFLCFEWEER